jgi:hypothetical protein
MKFSHLIAVVLLATNAHADSFVTDWLHEVNLQSEYKVLKQQVRDFREYQGSDTQKVMYEATGEISESREEIQRALPEKERALEKVKRDYARLVGSQS